jgi:hypothetical protein
MYKQKPKPSYRVDILASKKSLFTVTECKVYIQLQMKRLFTVTVSNST